MAKGRSISPWAIRCGSPATAGTSATSTAIDNGRIDAIKAFTPEGDIVLSNGWVVGKDFAHIKHGLVQTSPATQSKTDDIVLAAMNKASLGAMSAEQGYVTVSRGRERGMIFTDLPREELLRGRLRAATTACRPRSCCRPEAAAAASGSTGGEGGTQDAELHGKGAGGLPASAAESRQVDQGTVPAKGDGICTIRCHRNGYMTLPAV